ncbi:phosphoglycerate mutase-like protein 1 isoform X1 [Selaginella moellendorffii]|uniref:phosphoglycerate mutase-like protein 1 isoform X1 n=1 Tax=Selaginella moellendorffii TaxID=88036 RepID=UPI000D1C5807|nr:phosphoglycerate mutase-like protein 1 isoform X1 [Selaginella moellendorffii]|eukprot:XP_024544563.1 phosphoglycerate mutase-like protein 1 isoform X1 [Selaginella moellendorffii]
MEEAKIIHLVRHAEAFHNVDGDVSLHRLFFRGEWRHLSPRLLIRVLRPFWRHFQAWLLSFIGKASLKQARARDQNFFDPKLTPNGWEQVRALILYHSRFLLISQCSNQIGRLRKIVGESGIDRRVQLVVVSPLTRTLQTAVGVFGSGEIGSPPFVAQELCRERMSVRSSDKRRAISNYAPMFTTVDFSQIEDDDDKMWNPDTPETMKELQERITLFLQWLWDRKETEIAVVSHSSFLRNMLKRANLLLPNCQLTTVRLTRSGCDFRFSDA